VNYGHPCDLLAEIAFTHPELFGDGRTNLNVERVAELVRSSCLTKRNAKSFKASRTAFAAPTMDGLSTEAAGLVDQIQALITGYTNPTNLASGLSGVLDAADGLDPTETEIIQGSVAVAQSSMEYWMNSTNQASESSSFESGFGACTSENPMVDCLGMSSDPYEMSLHGVRRRDQMHLAVFERPMLCPGTDWVEIGHADVLGGVGGALGAGPAGIIPGAGGMSAAEAWWQLGKHLWCLYAT
jgi:hypothetical protein